MSVSVSASSALTPLALNFAGLKRYVANYVQGASDDGVLDVAGQAINAGVHMFNRRNWQWNVATQTITLTANDDDYELNDDVKRPLKLWRLNASSNREGRIAFKSSKVFMDEHPWKIGGNFPAFYTIISPVQENLLLLNVAPSAAYVSSYPTLKFYYYPRIKIFADDNDTMSDVNLWPEAWDILGWYGRWEFAMVRGMTGRTVDRAHVHWKDQYRDLIADNEDVQTDWD